MVVKAFPGFKVSTSGSGVQGAPRSPWQQKVLFVSDSVIPRPESTILRIKTKSRLDLRTAPTHHLNKIEDTEDFSNYDQCTFRAHAVILRIQGFAWCFPVCTRRCRDMSSTFRSRGNFQGWDCMGHRPRRRCRQHHSILLVTDNGIGP